MKAPRLFISRRKGVVVLFALALVTSLLLPGIVRADHSSFPSNDPTVIGAGKGEFHYLDQTLSWGDVSTVTVAAGTYTITIVELVNMTHKVEFKLGDTKFLSKGLPKGGTITLTVTLTPGTWKVTCLPHVKKGAWFYLTVTE